MRNSSLREKRDLLDFRGIDLNSKGVRFTTQARNANADLWMYAKKYIALGGSYPEDADIYEAVCDIGPIRVFGYWEKESFLCLAREGDGFVKIPVTYLSERETLSV